ncbi:MAG: hypothetical protein R2726_00725 [Acidimicrobiales bacterium]
MAEPIDAGLLERALGPELVHRLVANRVVEIERGGPNRFVRSSHPLVAEVLVDRMDPARRREAVRALVELTEQAGVSTDADHVRLAVWRLDAGLPIGGAEALRRWPRDGASDAALAQALARLAVEAGSGRPPRSSWARRWCASSDGLTPRPCWRPWGPSSTASTRGSSCGTPKPVPPR